MQLTTDEGDVVLGPFCGSGTSCVVAKLLGRKYTGIDTSNEVIALSRQRLSNSIETESSLLKNGRESYINASKNALRLLNGIAFNPVHRNKGIDAILVKQFENTPVLARVQKNNETLSDAA